MSGFGEKIEQLLEGFNNAVEKVRLIFSEANAPVRALGEIVSNAPWYISGAIGLAIVSFTIWLIWRAFTK